MFIDLKLNKEVMELEDGDNFESITTAKIKESYSSNRKSFFEQGHAKRLHLNKEIEALMKLDNLFLSSQRIS